MTGSKLQLRRIPLAWTVVCLSSAGVLLAQQGPALIEGRVFDAATSEALSKVEVMLFEGGGGEIRATRTDTRGNYGFSDVAPGTYKLTANRNGWAHQEYRNSKRSRRAARLVVRPGLQLTDLDFRLDRAAILFGRVTDEASSPLVGARVILYESRYEGLGRQLVPGAGAETNDLGEYRLHNIQPGHYHLGVDYQDHLLGDPNVRYERIEEGDYTRIYYPGVLDPDDALPVRVRPGELRGLDVEMRRVRTFRVAGVIKVAGTDALPPNVGVEMTPRRDILDLLHRRVESVDGTTGGFEFASVPPGPYVLVAGENVDGIKHYVYEPIEVLDRSVENLDLRLEPGATVFGRVRLEGKGADRLFNLAHDTVDDRLWASPKPEP